MNVTISISKAEVYEQVAMITSYVGVNSVDAAGDTLYERVFTTPHNQELLDGYFSEACSRISLVMRQFLICLVSSEVDCTIKLNMPSNCVADYVQSICDNVFSYVINYIVAQWFSVTNQTAAQQYVEIATGQATELSAKLYVRRAPKRLDI